MRRRQHVSAALTQLWRGRAFQKYNQQLQPFAATALRERKSDQGITLFSGFRLYCVDELRKHGRIRW